MNPRLDDRRGDAREQFVVGTLQKPGICVLIQNSIESCRSSHNMNALSQFLITITGGILGILIISLFKPVRARFLQNLVMVVAIGFTIPIYKVTFDRWQYGILLLPVVGGILAGAGMGVGELVAWLRAKKRAAR